MISRSKKKVDDPESDSDWDSLPGDVSELRSSAEHKLPKAQVPSLSPVPPKQSSTHSKHPTTSKATNSHKNNLNSSKKAGGATTFEDKSGGLWDDDDDDDEGNSKKFGVSRESNNNNVKENSKVLKEKKDRRRVQEQEFQKRPPFTDFQDALSTPIPPSQGRIDHHELAGVNQAYRIDKGDEIHVANHDSWDDSENESVSQLQQSDLHQKDTTAVKQEHIIKRNSEQKQKSKRIKQDKSKFEPHALELVQYQSNANTDMQFENCCLIQVAHGPFHDRYRPSFYHGSKNHFHIREDDPRATVTDIAEKSEVVLQRFWREVFGVLQILINFFIIFILEFFKVLVHSMQNFITGILYIIGDHLTKPLLSAIFNNIIQPFSILLLNIFTILTNLFKPVLALTRELFNQLAIPLKAFRLFELNWGSCKTKEDSTCTDIKVI